MENKLTWVELKKVVARQTQLTEKEVNLILTTWLDEMVSALKRGDELHISGLGTFKMKTMKPRKSVNVTTGEAIILPQTDRLTFTMASAMEEHMRDDAPSRMEVGQDPIKKLSAQADEIMDIIGEIEQIQPAKPAKPAQPVQPAKPAKPAQPAKPAKPAQPAKPAKPQRLWLTAGITIVVFICLLIGLFFFFQHRLEKWLIDLRAQAEMVELTDTIVPVDTIIPTAPVAAIEPVETVGTIEIAKPNYRNYTDFIGTENMHKDSRLAWMAYRYYGNKKLWVFIYDANKDHLTSPENIPVGTPIRIPKLSQEILDFGEDIQTLVEEMYKEFIGER